MARYHACVRSSDSFFLSFRISSSTVLDLVRVDHKNSRVNSLGVERHPQAPGDNRFRVERHASIYLCTVPAPRAGSLVESCGMAMEGG